MGTKDEITNDDGDQTGGDNESDDLPPISKMVEKTQEPKKLQAPKNNLSKSVNVKLNKVEWPTDEDIASSITEDSSGSSYVRIVFST